MNAPRIAVTSRTVCKRPWLATTLGGEPRYAAGWARSAVHLEIRRASHTWSAVAGWGNKASGQRAAQWSAALDLPCWRLEDGFLRSAGDGRDEQALSLVVDDVGIYYDASMPSRLEMLIEGGAPTDAAARCADLVAQWRAHRLSKYNHVAGRTMAMNRPYVLLVDQTAGDCSIGGALAGPRDFSRMVEAALDRHPASTILLKTHPDVISGRKQGCIDTLSPGAAARVQVLATDVHAPDVLENAAHVYVVSSQMGFEALLWGRPVHTFGLPFYAGWGLSEDNGRACERRRQASLDDLVHAALIAYPRYVDPETGQRCEVENVMAHIGLQRRMHAEQPARLDLIGFSRWKRPVARMFFSRSKVRFVRSLRHTANDRDRAEWGGANDVTGQDDAAQSRPARLLVEDGFIRSVGLGARGVRPQSWVIDDCGIYYDATRPSRLEQWLARGEFDAPLLARADRLIARIRQSNVTKYNLGGLPWQTIAGSAPKRTLLVVGQVENDRSLLLGLSAYPSNEAFLRAVRIANPDARILFRPHPDVAAGLRSGAVSSTSAQRLCDAVVDKHDLDSLFAHIDEVHVMTSLTGFEALLRGKRVVTHGAPFYAGWGLTHDLALPEFVIRRRHRRLGIHALAAATLILYPRYISCVTKRFTTPERVLNEIALICEGRLPNARQRGYCPPLAYLRQRCTDAWRRMGIRL